jgi:hypothetical protein
VLPNNIYHYSTGSSISIPARRILHMKQATIYFYYSELNNFATKPTGSTASVSLLRGLCL